jgi:hypothetical protein
MMDLPGYCFRPLILNTKNMGLEAFFCLDAPCETKSKNKLLLVVPWAPSMEVGSFEHDQKQAIAFDHAWNFLSSMLESCKHDPWEMKDAKNLKQKKTRKKKKNITSTCCQDCVSPTSYKNKNTMNTYVRISSNKLGFPIHSHKPCNEAWFQAQFLPHFIQDFFFVTTSCCRVK